jgi:hypothetical protein
MVSHTFPQSLQAKWWDDCTPATTNSFHILSNSRIATPPVTCSDEVNQTVNLGTACDWTAYFSPGNTCLESNLPFLLTHDLTNFILLWNKLSINAWWTPLLLHPSFTVYTCDHITRDRCHSQEVSPSREAYMPHRDFVSITSEKKEGWNLLGCYDMLIDNLPMSWRISVFLYSFSPLI